MDGAVLDCLVTGYEPRIPTLTLPDPNDRHVLAAAIECAADVIVTKNLGDFPQIYLNQFGVEATHPDGFVRSLLENEPDTVLRALHDQRAAYRDPTLTAEEFVAALENCELKETAAVLRSRHLDRL